jgi:3-dehydroquinate dehydratase / shikimate dehydrogenase
MNWLLILYTFDTACYKRLIFNRLQWKSRMSLFGKGVARICAVVACRTAREMARQFRAALRETPTVELRLDWLNSDVERTRLLSRLRNNKPRNATIIATCRRTVGGGKFRGDAQAELDWLRRAREAGCTWGDLEIESYAAVRRQLDSDRSRLPRILLSLHDFKRTPAKLAIPGSRKADAVKIAAQAQTIVDSLKVLQQAHNNRNWVAVSMGEVGLPARILALREGSVLAYAPVSQATAPGQVSLTDLKYLYRAHKLTRKTQVFAVIGDPVGHSLSPLLHNKAFVARGIDAVYVPFLVKDFRDFRKAIPEFGIRGFSVTLPHKKTILKYLDECDALAADIGAVNTVVVQGNGALHGCNTDHAGVLRSLERKLRLRGSRVLILGAGGSARAAAFALARAGAVVDICARREQAARELAQAVGGEVIPRRALRTERFDAILNATPVGMYPHDRISPLQPSELNCRIVMDLIYRPERTQFLKLASSKGIATVSGVEMFLAQGAAQWEIWMRRRAPEAVMRRAVLAALRAESRGLPRRAP